MKVPDGKEATMPGLFQLDGDTAKFCFLMGDKDGPRKDRPKEIAAKDDTMMVTLKKKEKK